MTGQRIIGEGAHWQLPANHCVGQRRGRGPPRRRRRRHCACAAVAGAVGSVQHGEVTAVSAASLRQHTRGVASSVGFDLCGGLRTIRRNPRVLTAVLAAEPMAATCLFPCGQPGCVFQPERHPSRGTGDTFAHHPCKSH